METWRILRERSVNKMTIHSMYKICPKCHQKYKFNPDVGQGMFCPYCGGTGLTKENSLKKIINQIKDKID